MKMRDDELVALCQAEIDACLGGDSGEIGTERAYAMDRYLGEPYGNETEGRSQVRTREVADTIEWILPSLMRIFFDSENAVEFAARGPEDEQQVGGQIRVLVRRGGLDQFRVGVGRDRDRAVHVAGDFPAVDVLASHAVLLGSAPARWAGGVPAPKCVGTGSNAVTPLSGERRLDSGRTGARGRDRAAVLAGRASFSKRGREL